MAHYYEGRAQCYLGPKKSYDSVVYMKHAGQVRSALLCRVRIGRLIISSIAKLQLPYLHVNHCKCHDPVIQKKLVFRLSLGNVVHSALGVYDGVTSHYNPVLS